MYEVTLEQGVLNKTVFEFEDAEMAVIFINIAKMASKTNTAVTLRAEFGGESEGEK